MQKFLLMVMLALGSATLAFAQGGDQKRDGGRVEALKIAYLTKKLDLTQEEAQKFWPIYNEYTKEIRKARIDARKDNKSELDVEEKLLNIRKKYEVEFSKAISKEKVNTFFRAEKEFGTLLQKELMERRQQRLQQRKLQKADTTARH